MAKAKKNQDDSVGVDTMAEEDTDGTEAEAETDSRERDTDAASGGSDSGKAEKPGKKDKPGKSGASGKSGGAAGAASSRSGGVGGASGSSGSSGSDSVRDSSRPQAVPVSSGGSASGSSSDSPGTSGRDSGDSRDSRDSGGDGGSSGGGRGGSTGEGNVRRAHLTLSRVEPWSVMKFSFVISLVCFIILFVAVAVVYLILSALGVFDAITELITSLTDGGEEDDLGLNPETWFSAARVLGYTGLWGAANIVLITALSTFGSMLYNLAADLVGGLDITLSESE